MRLFHSSYRNYFFRNQLWHAYLKKLSERKMNEKSIYVFDLTICLRCFRWTNDVIFFLYEFFNFYFKQIYLQCRSKEIMYWGNGDFGWKITILGKIVKNGKHIQFFLDNLPNKMLFHVMLKRLYNVLRPLLNQSKSRE
jgi:hypothetical protein